MDTPPKPMKPTKMSRWTLFAGAVALTAATCAAAASCTVFNGLTVPEDPDGASPGDVTAAEAGGDDSPGTVGDAGVDACVGPGQGYLGLTEAARVCTTLFECGEQLEFDIETSLGLIAGNANYAVCMNWLAGATAPDRVGRDIQQQTLKCMARGTTCAQAWGCLGTETFDPTSDPRCKDGGAQLTGVHCADNNANTIGCDDGLVYHCGSPPFAGGGLNECAIEGDPKDAASYTCGEQVDPCTVRTTSCDLATSILSSCDKGSTTNQRFDCRAMGLTCGPTGADSGPRYSCLTNGTYMKCDGQTFTNKCIGDNVATCNLLETVSEINCKALGKKCSMAEGQPLCVGADDTCSPLGIGVGICNGDVLSLCVDGKPVTYDCACAGMTCSSDGGAGQAHCARH